MTKRRFNIALMRERAGYSQQEAAAAIGVKIARYGDWERETTQINLRDAVRLADLFDCSLDELANHGVTSRSPLTPDEQTIVDGYRVVSDAARRRIRRAVDGELEDVELDAREKRDA